MSLLYPRTATDLQLSLLYLVQDIKKICILHSISYLISLFFYRADGGSARTSKSRTNHSGSRGRKGTNINRTPRNYSSQIGQWLDCFRTSSDNFFA